MHRPKSTCALTDALRYKAFWWPDIATLGIFFGVFTVASYLILHFYVKEKR